MLSDRVVKGSTSLYVMFWAECIATERASHDHNCGIVVIISQTHVSAGIKITFWHTILVHYSNNTWHLQRQVSTTSCAYHTTIHCNI